MRIRVTVAGMVASKRFLSKLKSDSVTETAKLLEKIGEDIAADAKSNLQQNLNINSGSLLADIDVKEKGPDFVVVGSDLGYAGIIEYGRGEVRGKDKPLTWIDKSTGDRVFSWKSKPVAPSPYLEPAVLDNAGKFSDLYTEKMTQIITSQGDVVEEL